MAATITTAPNSTSESNESNNNRDELSLEKFTMWSAKALKVFLHVRGKDVEGSHEELAARAFTAWCDKVRADPKLEHEEKSVLDEYRLRLVVENIVIPDPITLTEGWKGEENGITSWPPVYFCDISSFLGLSEPDFINRLQSEYKQGKAYRYFSCEFVREIFIHELDKLSPQCVLKCRVIPSQRVSHKPYDVWAVVQKTRGETPGGKILSGYCSCVAGLSSACNHLVAMLFRVEYLVSRGVTNPSQTSVLCSWNVPKGKTVDVKPKPIKELVFEKSHYAKPSSSSQKLADDKKRFLDFSPASESHAIKLRDTENRRKELYEILKDDIPASCFVECFEGKPKSSKGTESEPSKTIMETRDEFEYNSDLSQSENITLFTEQLKATPKQIKTIKLITKEQAACSSWHEQRKGRITASNFHKICTRMKTLEKDPTQNANNLIKSLLYKGQFETAATKHGKNMEAHAKAKYTLLVKRCHKKFSTNECGMTVMEGNSYIGASPDLEINCQCCGEGLLEIKCPFSIRDQSPTNQNLEYLEGNKLKKTHGYFDQIQGQMGVTGRLYCDFFVFTHHGYHLERISFNKDCWLDILQNLQTFWHQHLAPEILNKSLFNSLETPSTTSADNIDFEVIYSKNTPETIETTTDQTPRQTKTTTKIEDQTPRQTKTTTKMDDQMPRQNKNTVKRKIDTKVDLSTTKAKSRKTKISTWFCGQCKKKLKDNPKTYATACISCDLCLVWFHFKCVGIKKSEEPAENVDWVCADCSKL